MLPKLCLQNVTIDILADVDKSGSTEEVRDREKKSIHDEVLAKNKCINDLKLDGHTFDVVFYQSTTRRICSLLV